MIGPTVIDPEPSKERSRRVFAAVLKDQARWSFSEQGARIDFGELLGVAAGPFFCGLSNADLRVIAHPGAVLPP